MRMSRKVPKWLNEKLTLDQQTKKIYLHQNLDGFSEVPYFQVLDGSPEVQINDNMLSIISNGPKNSYTVKLRLFSNPYLVGPYWDLPLLTIQD